MDLFPFPFPYNQFLFLPIPIPSSVTILIPIPFPWTYYELTSDLCEKNLLKTAIQETGNGPELRCD